MKKLIYGIIIIFLIGALVIKNIYIENKNQELVNNYVTCLKENFTQRDYCSQKLGSNYYYLDSLLKQYGYSYNQIGNDLFVVEATND